MGRVGICPPSFLEIRGKKSLKIAEFVQFVCTYQYSWLPMYGIQYDFLPQTMDSNFSLKLSKFSLIFVFIYVSQFKLSNLNITLESYFEICAEFQPQWQIQKHQKQILMTLSSNYLNVKSSTLSYTQLCLSQSAKYLIRRVINNNSRQRNKKE